MNRRSFLRAFTGAAVGAAVIAINPPSAEMFTGAIASPKTRYLTLADLDMSGYIEQIRKQFEEESVLYRMIRNPKDVQWVPGKAIKVVMDDEGFGFITSAQHTP